MRKIILTLIAATAAVAAQAFTVTPADVVNPHTADRYDYVSDMAGVIDAAQEDSINAICLRLDSLAGMELAVVTIDSLGDQDPFQFSVDVYQKFGIGKNDNGILIFVAVADHRWEIRTGYEAEGTLTDALCSKIGRNYMVPKFRENDYGGGILAAIVEIYDVTVTPKAMEALQNDSAAGDDDMTFLYLFAGIALLLGIVAYIRSRKSRPKCPHCGAQSTKKMSSKTVEEPTYTKEGKSEVTYQCKKCGTVFVVTAVLAALRAVSRSSGGGNFGGGGFSSGGGSGFSGGSFGGGNTGGGGAGGSW